MAEELLRSFIAIELSEAMKQEASSFVNSLAKRYTGFRFLSPQNWHLTLHFLGKVEFERLEVLQTRLDKTLTEVKPFSIFLDGIGVFPEPKQPRVIWLGINGDLTELLTLKKMLDQALQKMHFDMEQRTYRPHVTIARTKERKVSAVSLTDQETRFRSQIVDRVSQVTLFKSDLTPQGAVHSVLRQFQFGHHD